MKESDREYLINELVKDLQENPDDEWHIINGLKQGYPDLAVEIGLEVIQRLQDKELIESTELQESLAQMRRGQGYTVRI